MKIITKPKTYQQVRLTPLLKTYLSYYSKKLRCSEHRIMLEAINDWAERQPFDEVQTIKAEVMAALDAKDPVAAWQRRR